MLNSKFPLIKSENHSKKSELPLIWGVKRRTTRKRIVLRLTPQTSGNSLFLESFSLYMGGNLLFNVQNHSFLSGLQEFHSFGEWNFHSFTFREHFQTACHWMAPFYFSHFALTNNPIFKMLSHLMTPFLEISVKMGVMLSLNDAHFHQ